jgi:hypothetical protein
VRLSAQFGIAVMFGRGDPARTISGALRCNPDGLDLAALVEIAAKANNLDRDGAKLTPIVKTRVNNALHRYMNKGEVINRKGPDRERREEGDSSSLAATTIHNL